MLGPVANVKKKKKNLLGNIRSHVFMESTFGTVQEWFRKLLLGSPKGDL